MPKENNCLAKSTETILKEKLFDFSLILSGEPSINEFIFLKNNSSFFYKEISSPFKVLFEFVIMHPSAAIKPKR